ncbi:hypothetical protein BCR39DRAFT_496308 [Naematelia encephala]|uniref:Uncharacterized protein n=1 Tax=Naematelia encephala TaxID=71784 RepID=A0A1Y2B1Z7_9TREE|nr:hypothetical protein BCR39DRAFT_496308 [Naematelia encephala]
MSAVRPAALRLAANAPSRALPIRQARLPVYRSQHVRQYATVPPPAATPPPPPASGSSGGGNGPMYIVLGAIIALGAGGWYYLKPVRDVAHMAHSTVSAVKDQASQISDTTGGLSGIAKSMLPPGAFALYSHLSESEGGVNGFLSSLKDKDLQGVLDEVKKVGGDDVKRIVDKVEQKVKDANGKVQNVDWRALAQELKGELPKGSQQAVDMLIGRIPDKEDFEKMINDVKKIGEDKLKEVEQSASKILAAVDKAKKEGKGQADAFLTGLKNAAPADIDALIKQLKDAAKSAGLPADQTEAWLKAKAEDGKINAEELAQQVESKLKTVAHFIPGEPKDFIKQVEQFSPSVAKLLQQAMVQAGVTDEKGNRK